MKKTVVISLITIALLTSGLNGQDAVTLKGAKHVVVFSQPGWFAGWPANNGVWSWEGGKEILVGFSYGRFVEQEGHNIEGKSDTTRSIRSYLARSTDGGMTWIQEDPSGFVGDGIEPVASPGQINFQTPSFAMRVMGIGYHGSLDPQGAFFISENKGKNWHGPYRFNGLMEDPNLTGMICTSRTGYLVTGPASCLIFMSARPKQNGSGKDKAFVAETSDGGKSFRFVTWIVPLNDPYRAVMPAVVRLEDGSIVAALRRRMIDKDVCWVDAYGSVDNGKTWNFLGRVGETGDRNGNPPALVALRDGRLACAYGDRSRVKLFVKLSPDGGKTWGDEIIVRDDFQPDKFNDKDFGYPRLAVNHENKLVVLYYWATKPIPEHHIAGTIWKP